MFYYTNFYVFLLLSLSTTNVVSYFYESSSIIYIAWASIAVFSLFRFYQYSGGDDDDENKKKKIFRFFCIATMAAITIATVMSWTKNPINPDVISNIIPDIIPDVKPNVNPDVIPNVNPDVIPNVNPDVIPNIIPDVFPSYVDSDETIDNSFIYDLSQYITDDMKVDTTNWDTEFDVNNIDYDHLENYSLDELRQVIDAFDNDTIPYDKDLCNMVCDYVIDHS